MNDNDLEVLQKLSNSFLHLKTKIILYDLLDKANEEYVKCDYSTGRETLKTALNVEPDSPEALRGLGCIEQFQNKDYEKAIEYFLKALEFSEHKEIEYTLIGMAYYLMECLDESLKYFNLAIEENEDYTSAYEGRNQAMLEQHLQIADLQEALERYF